MPVTVRGPTSDDADIRLLLDARVTSTRLTTAELERITLAHVVPATAAWVRGQELATLEDTLGPRLRDVEESVCHLTRELGADLVALEVVAVEHLIISPSGNEDGGNHGIS